MKEITLRQASKLTSPNPVTLICTEKPNGSTNLATVSWWSFLSYNPGMICFIMGKNAFSGERARATGKVVLTVPGAAIAEAALACGESTGRNTDKAKQFGIELTGFANSTILVPVHSRLVIQCSLKEYHEVGDHYLHICNVEQVYGDPSEDALYAWDGYSALRPIPSSH